MSLGYIDLRCSRGYDNSCGARIYLITSQVVDPFGDGWTPNNESWSLECQNGHILASSTEVYEDDEHPPLPTVMFARHNVEGILDFTTRAKENQK